MKQQNKSVVMATWKDGRKDPIEIYSSLVTFMSNNKGFVKATLENYLSRKKIAYENNQVSICRIKVITRR